MKSSHKQQHGQYYSTLLLFFLVVHVATAQTSSDPTTTDDGYNFNNTVNPSMAIIVIVLVLAFFITGCVSIYIQQCSDNTITVPGASPATTKRQEKGLDETLLATFPIFPFSNVKNLNLAKGSSLECAVCLNEFTDDETLRLLPKCDHVFHPECIDMWLASHVTCPVCRANLEEVEEVRVSVEDEERERSKAPFPLTRSHSTGHSLGDSERFTLRLPAEVRRQLMTRTRLKRATSLVALPRVSSSRRGFRGGEGSGSSRYGRMLFGEMWPFKLTAKGSDDDGGLTVGSKRFSASAVAPVEGLPQRLPV